jgi:hypothetical protein
MGPTLGLGVVVKGDVIPDLKLQCHEEESLA